MSYMCLFILGNVKHVFRLAAAPKEKRIVEFAEIIVPPNSVAPIKDRHGLFNPDIHTVVTEDEVLSVINDWVDMDKARRMNSKEKGIGGRHW